jgi:hypothetical protein
MGGALQEIGSRKSLRYRACLMAKVLHVQREM